LAGKNVAFDGHDVADLQVVALCDIDADDRRIALGGRFNARGTDSG
jgi:hypothetical protein